MDKASKIYSHSFCATRHNTYFVTKLICVKTKTKKTKMIEIFRTAKPVAHVK